VENCLESCGILKEHIWGIIVGYIWRFAPQNTLKTPFFGCKSIYFLLRLHRVLHMFFVHQDISWMFELALVQHVWRIILEDFDDNSKDKNSAFCFTELKKC